jgi:hypothetical protein
VIFSSDDEMRIHSCTPGDTAKELLKWFLVELTILLWMVVQKKEEGDKIVVR